ncbi:hypothetical protein CLOM_g21301 [Closterium sp. NIES-68]|nr:hypothetical protein CLOM_g21301 [Closterium sp. NIES-68]GJP82887.1 hypothetical protein CLOP_g13112 [Closterium sp. NIES-67]
MMGKRVSSNRSSALTLGSAATPWILQAVLFAAVLSTAPPLAAAHPDENLPHGPKTKKPRGCYKFCNNLELGFYINRTDDTWAAGAEVAVANYNFERYVFDDTAEVIKSAQSSQTLNKVRECCERCALQVGCSFWHLRRKDNSLHWQCTLLKSKKGVTATNWNTKQPPSYFGGECNPEPKTDDDPHFRGADGTRFDFNGLLGRSFCLISDRRIHINMGINGYRPIANLPGTATSLDEDSLAAALEAVANEKKPRHIRELEQERLSADEVAELERMRANGSLPLTAEVVAALERESGNRGEEEKHSIQYEKDELKARLLKGKAIRSWIRELQVMWRDEIGSQHSAYIKARDGKEQGRGNGGFIDRLEIDGQPVAPPFAAGSFVASDGGFKLLLEETRSKKGKEEDAFQLTIQGVVDMGVTARVAHPLMQTADEAQAHFNVAIEQLNNTEGIHGVLGQTFRGEPTRKVQSLRYRLLTRLLREAVDVESESGRGFLDGRMEDYITSGIGAPDCMFAAAWRRGEHENSDGSDFMR